MCYKVQNLVQADPLEGCPSWQAISQYRIYLFECHGTLYIFSVLDVVLYLWAVLI